MTWDGWWDKLKQIKGMREARELSPNLMNILLGNSKKQSKTRKNTSSFSTDWHSDHIYHICLFIVVLYFFLWWTHINHATYIIWHACRTKTKLMNIPLLLLGKAISSLLCFWTNFHLVWKQMNNPTTGHHHDDCILRKVQIFMVAFIFSFFPSGFLTISVISLFCLIYSCSLANYSKVMISDPRLKELLLFC